MENEIEKKENTEDEISLLDLFAVLIRYRKLVVFGTGIVTVLAILWLFILPMFSKKSAAQNAQVTYTIRVQQIPISIGEKLPNAKTITPIYLATYTTSRLPFLVEQIKENNVFSSSNTEMSDYEFNAYVQGLLKNKKIKIESSPLGTDYTIDLLVPIDKINDANRLINSIVTDVDQEIQNYYMPLITTLQQNTEVSIEKALSLQSGSSDISSLQTLQEFSTDINEFLESFSSFVEVRGEPFIVPEGRGRTKKLIIICFASFFIFVFIAFVRNAIANIKADPESSKLISDAWNAGK